MCIILESNNVFQKCSVNEVDSKKSACKLISLNEKINQNGSKGICLEKKGRWLKGNDIKTASTTGSDYWTAYVGSAKIKTDGPKRQTRTNVIPINDLSYFEYVDV